MGNLSFFNNAIESKLRDLHCAYIGKVLSTNGTTAKVQPLGLFQQASGEKARAKAVVDDVPIACRYKISQKTITFSVGEGTESQVVAVPEELKAGDIVVCLCADYNISAARKGKNELPPAGRHKITDSIIVGIL